MKSTIKQLLRSSNVIPQPCSRILKELLVKLEDEFREGGRGFEYLQSHSELQRPNSKRDSQ